MKTVKHIAFYSTILLAASFILSASSCRKPDDGPVDPPGPQTGAVKLEFFNKVGGDNLVMNTQWYKNEHNDSFTVSKFNYYITNIRLNGTSKTYTESESYHLIEQDKEASRSFDMPAIPSGTYNSITFMIGVDSTRNVSGAQTGALDPVNGMFWTWNSGYIMVKFEGTSPKSTATGKIVQIHCGGFKGVNSVLREVTLTFPQPIEVGSKENHIHLDADILKMFKSPNIIDFATTNTVMSSGATAKMVADNYANMFSIGYAGL